jgi:hypothetical protein
MFVNTKDVKAKIFKYLDAPIGNDTDFLIEKKMRHTTMH